MSENIATGPNAAQVTKTTLGVLSAIDKEESITQRGLARRLGIALGLTNAVIKRCVRKGLLKVHDAPARRYAYYLTPRGFQEKSRLTSQYLLHSLDFFRRVRAGYLDAICYCKHRGWTRIALYGAGELAEIASLSAKDADLDLIAIIDPKRNERRFCDIQVVRDLSEIDNGPDAIVITSAESPQQAFDDLSKEFPAANVITPGILHVSRGNG